MSTANDVLDYVRAGFPIIWVQTHEESRCIKAITGCEITSESGDKISYNIYEWDIISGLIDMKTGKPVDKVSDPVKAIAHTAKLPEGSIIFLKDYHKFINNIEAIRAIKIIYETIKMSNKHFIIISPVSDIPVELDKDITVMSFDLPSMDNIINIAHDILADAMLDSENIDGNVLSAAKGLTLVEVENALSLSIIKEKAIMKYIIDREKLNGIRKTGVIDICDSISEEEVGGLKPLIQYLKNRKVAFDNDKIAECAKPHGIILVGPPGTGKSMSARLAAGIFNLPLIRMDINSLKGSLVGESEKNMRNALSIIKGISPVIVWMDEFEKAFAGVASSARTDGGTTLGMIGKLMTTMQDFRDQGVPVYWIATVNDMESLISNSQGAMMRRFDDIFYVDFPGVKEKQDIITIMNKKYGSDIPIEYADKMPDWTGAEIEKLAMSSLYDGLEEGFDMIRPIYKQSKAEIDRGKQWAEDNARFANEKEEMNIVAFAKSKKTRKMEI